LCKLFFVKQNNNATYRYIEAGQMQSLAGRRQSLRLAHASILLAYSSYAGEEDFTCKIQ
jgi:hypothetical protein